MTQFSNSFFDGVSRLMTHAVGAAEGAKRELDTATRARVEKFLNDFGVVKRDEFEVLKAIAIAARDENERLAVRIAELEKRLGLDSAQQAPVSDTK